MDELTNLTFLQLWQEMKLKTGCILKCTYTGGQVIPYRHFLQNILGCYSGTTQDSETNDTSIERPTIELLENVMKEGVAVS